MSCGPSPILARLAYAALGAMVALGAVAFLQREKPSSSDALPVLVRKGYVPDQGKPTIPDLPKGAKAVAVVEGAVHYRPGASVTVVGPAGPRRSAER